MAQYCIVHLSVLQYTRDVTIWVDAILRIAFECIAILQYVVRLTYKGTYHVLETSKKAK